MEQSQSSQPITSCDRGVYWTPASLLALLYPTWLHRAAGVPYSEPEPEPLDCSTVAGNPPFLTDE